MRVLFIANDRVWPLMTGLAHRLHHLSTGLALRHEVTLLVMEPTGDGDSFPQAELFTSIHTVAYSSCRFALDAAAGKVDGRGQRLVRAVRCRTPAFVDRFESRLLQTTVVELVARDAIDVVWVSRAHFAEHIRKVTDVPIVVDLDDIESVAQGRSLRQITAPVERVVRRVELQRLRRWERSLPHRVEGLAVCKEEDLAHLAPDGRPVVVVRNGMDDVPVADPARERSDEILFVGNLEYPPNIDAVTYFSREVLPRIRERRPSTRFVIVGHRPGSDVLELDDGDGCVVCADVADLTDSYDRAAVVVVPMRLGSGTRIKAIEAMMRGKALVCTSIGIEGVDARPGIEYIRADRPDRFADACCALLGDATRRRQLGAAARTRMRTSYDWKIAVQEADDLLHLAVDPVRPAGPVGVPAPRRVLDSET